MTSDIEAVDEEAYDAGTLPCILVDIKKIK